MASSYVKESACTKVGVTCRAMPRVDSTYVKVADRIRNNKRKRVEAGTVSYDCEP